jgi:hypothetical protein
MKRYYFAMSLLIATMATAAIVVTETPGIHELRDAESHAISKHPTHEACVAAAGTIGVGRYRCVNVTIVDVAGACDPNPPAPIVDAEGFTEVGTLEGQLCPDGVRYSFTQTQPVLDPYPACWVQKPVPITDCTTLIHDFWTAP